MTSYSAIWEEEGSPFEVGRLELDPHGVSFHGVSREHRIFFEDIESVHIGRSPAERLAGRPSLVVARHGGGPVRIGSLDGLGALNELAGVLAHLTATPLAI